MKRLNKCNYRQKVYSTIWWNKIFRTHFWSTFTFSSTRWFVEHISKNLVPAYLFTMKRPCLSHTYNAEVILTNITRAYLILIIDNNVSCNKNMGYRNFKNKKNQVFKIQKKAQRIICEFKHNDRSFRRLWTKHNVILTFPCCRFLSIHFQSV